MQPIQLFDPAFSSYTYILFDESSRDALIVDPVDEQLERDLATLRQCGLTRQWTVEIHAHAGPDQRQHARAPRCGQRCQRGGWRLRGLAWRQG